MDSGNIPRGLRFCKLDLHLHTPASKCFADKTVTAEQIVNTAAEAGLDGIAVTDHNTTEGITPIQEAAKLQGLTVFPGAEITCQGGKAGVHLIALFDPSEDASKVQSLLNKIGIEPVSYGEEDAIAERTPQDVAQQIEELGGVTVLAHANSDRGVLSEMRGVQRERVIHCESIIGAEATDFRDEKKAQKQSRVVDLLDGGGHYQRKMAVYQASDNPHHDNSGRHGLSGIGSRCAYFKLEKIDLDGLRQALIDPDVRIRQDFEIQALRFPYLKAISVEGGFLDQAVVEFHPGLNSVLGAKGVGKSLLVELLRFGLGQQSRSEEIGRNADSMLQHRLGPHGRVTITFSDATGQEQKVQRTYLPPENPFLPPQAAEAVQEFPVMFLSQNEVIRIAESPRAQMEFIDGFLDFRRFQITLRRLEEELRSNDQQVADAIAARRLLSSLNEEVDSRNREIKKLEADLAIPAFLEYAKAQSKDSYLASSDTNIATVQDLLSNAARTVSEVAVSAPPEALNDDPSVQRARNTITEAISRAAAEIDQVRRWFDERLRVLSDDRARWQKRFKLLEIGYREAVSKAGGGRKELDARRTVLLAELKELKARIDSLGKSSESLTKLKTTRDQLLDELTQVYEKYSQARTARCTAMEQGSKGRLRITINPLSDREAFQRKLEEFASGSYVRKEFIEEFVRKVPARQMVYAILRRRMTGAEDRIFELAGSCSVDSERTIKLCQHLDATRKLEDLLALQYSVAPQDRPSIEFRVGLSRYEPLERVSVGQKSVALLIMALTEGTAPIVIDQPEDSLDLRSVWDDLCQKVRQRKDQRQFIFTTHNSSLAVASDTDCFTILDGDADHGEVLITGAMDHQPVKDRVLDFLEGGEGTYQLKARKYRMS